MRTRMTKPIALGLTLVGAIALESGIISPSVSAQPASAKKTVESPMKIVRFDPAIAKANGYEIRKFPDGREYSVKKGTPPVSSPTQLRTLSPGGGSIGGDCGTSWVRFNGTGNVAARLDTGFTLNTPAVGYSWQVSIIDQGGVSTQSWGGPLAVRQEWSGGRDLPNLTRGSADAQVERSSSVALITGAFCYSGGPRDSTIIY